MDTQRFVHCYNNVKFQENKESPFSVAEIRRKCLALDFFGSIFLRRDNDVTNYLLDRNLCAYSEIVDNQEQGNVSNYEESIMALLPPNQRDNVRTWKSNLDQIQLENLLNSNALPNKQKCSCDNIDERFYKSLKDAINQGIEQPVFSNLTKQLPLESAACVNKRNFPEFKESESKLNSEAQGADHNCDEPSRWSTISFRTAREELHLQNLKKHGKNYTSSTNEGVHSTAPIKKSLGTRKGGVFNKFQPPSRPKDTDVEQAVENRPSEELDERLKNIDPKMVELIKSEIMDCGTRITWDDIAGLELAKSTIQEIVVWPMLRPDIFTGLRRPPKGILLFGPPGTGKTLIGKCIASQSCSTFFSISASSLTSKWIGDGEKMVRALFAVARCHEPAVVFIDEIDSLLTQRSDSEHESSRRLKTEFLVQLDGAGTAEDDRILIIGATNRPQELDEAARRRLVKRLYIPLPDEKARKQIISNLISKERHTLSDEEIQEISVLCKGYSGADVKNLCQEASLGPIRSIPPIDIRRINPDQVRPLNVSDFKSALNRIKSSVSEGDLDVYIKWDKQYGCGSGGF